MHAIIKLAIDIIHTAPAAISLISFITGLIDCVIRLESFSIVVFIISSANTSAEHISITSHSVTDILKTIPAKKAIEAKSNCIRKFFSERAQCLIPCKAYIKELINRIFLLV